MHIVVVFSYKNSLNTWKESGILEREIKLFQELSSKFKYKFTFVTYGNSSEINLLSNNPNFKLLGVENIFIPSKNKYVNFIKSIKIPFYLKKYLQSFDLIFQNQIPGSWVSLMLKFLTKKPLILRTGYDIYKFSLHEKKSYIKIVFYKYLTYLSLLFANQYLVTNKTEKNFLMENFNFNFKKLQIVPNWVELPKLSNEKRDNFKALSVGRLEDQKNYSELLSNISSLENSFQIDIVGDGSQKNMLISKAEKLNINLTLLGRLDNTELIKAYKNYMFFISFSLYEGHPKAILEAMANGCIVIASNIENHNEIIKNNLNGIIFDLKKPELAKLISNLQKDLNLCLKIQQNARKTIFDNFTLEIVLEKYNEIFYKFKNFNTY